MSKWVVAYKVDGFEGRVIDCAMKVDAASDVDAEWKVAAACGVAYDIRAIGQETR